MSTGEETPGGPGRSRGLLVSLRELVRTVVAMLHTRTELFALELARERVRLTRLLLFTIAALVFLALGALTATIFVIVLFWDSQRLLVIGLLTLVYLGIGAGLALAARREIAASAAPFSASLGELKKDRERLFSR